MKFNLPRRQRKSFELVSGKSLDSNLNKKEALEIFENVKKSYSSAPNSFGSKKSAKPNLVIGSNSANIIGCLKLFKGNAKPEVNGLSL